MYIDPAKTLTKRQIAQCTQLWKS